MQMTQMYLRLKHKNGLHHIAACLIKTWKCFNFVSLNELAYISETMNKTSLKSDF